MLAALNGDRLQHDVGHRAVTGNGRHAADLVDDVGNSAAAAKNNATATQTVQDTLSAQQQSLSGVSLNEETVNLLQQQQAFQASARVVSVVQAMYTSLITAFGGV